MKEKNIGRILKEYGILTVGAIVMVLSDYIFKFPNHFTFGGVSGFAVLLTGIFGGSSNTYAFIINVVLFIIGFLVLGRDFGIKSVYVTLILTVGLGVVPYIFTVDEPLTNQPVLELVFTFMLAAASSAVFFNLGASSGGTDIIALILKKYTNIAIGKALLVTDFCIVILAFFTYGKQIGLFSLAGFLAKSFFVDTVIESLNLCKYFTIVSTNPEPICAFIHKELNHSATVYKAEGSYSHQERTVIMTVVNKGQAIKLRNFIYRTDEHAFIMITNSSEIIGNGFQGIV